MSNVYNLNKLWENYLYYMSVTVETPNGLTTLETVQVSSLYIEKDYDSNFLPIIILGLKLQKDVYYDVIKHGTKCRFILQIDKYIDTANTGKPRCKKVVIRDKFVPIIDDNRPFVDEKFYNSMKYGGGSKIGKQIIPYDLGETYEFVLVKESDFMVTKKTLNTVLSSANMMTAISAILSNAGASKVLMSKLDNTTTYNELITLPLPTIPQLKYLNSYYGLYKEGAQIFFDIDRTYILRNTAECTAWAKNELKDVAITINHPSSGEDIMTGSVVDDKQRTIFINTSENHVDMRDKSTSVDMTLGNNTTIVNTVDGSLSNVSTNTSGTGTSNIRTTNTRNPFAASELMLRQSELSNIVSVITRNIDISHVTPNKKYKILTNIPAIVNRVKGDYRLCRVIHQFVKEGDRFSVITNTELRRPN